MGNSVQAVGAEEEKNGSDRMVFAQRRQHQEHQKKGGQGIIIDWGELEQ